MKTKTCDDCPATIAFVRLDSGKPMPVDLPATPDDKGNVAAKLSGGDLVGYVVSAGKPLQSGYETYVAHWKNCPRGKAGARPRRRFSDTGLGDAAALF